jgi:hypothetical protein
VTSKGAVSEKNVRRHETRGPTTSICKIAVTIQNMTQLRGIEYLIWDGANDKRNSILKSLLILKHENILKESTGLSA